MKTIRQWAAALGAWLIEWAALEPSPAALARRATQVFEQDALGRLDLIAEFAIQLRQALDDHVTDLRGGIESVGGTVQATRTDWSAVEETLATLREHQTRRYAVARTPMGEPMPATVETPDETAAPLPRLRDTVRLLLMDPTGTRLEAETGWHHPAEAPLVHFHGGALYRRMVKHTNPEGEAWEYARAVTP